MPLGAKARITGLDAYAGMKSALNPGDLILWLASVSPIRGNVRLQKESFLLWMEYRNIAMDPGFRPARFGPYSQAVADSVRVLKSRRHLKEAAGRTYTITKSGMSYIAKKLQGLNAAPEQIEDRKIRWDEWKTSGIMTYVYRMYPEYTSRTEVPRLKW